MFPLSDKMNESVHYLLKAFPSLQSLPTDLYIFSLEIQALFGVLTTTQLFSSKDAAEHINVGILPFRET